MRVTVMMRSVRLALAGATVGEADVVEACFSMGNAMLSPALSATIILLIHFFSSILYILIYLFIFVSKGVYLVFKGIV